MTMRFYLQWMNCVIIAVLYTKYLQPVEIFAKVQIRLKKKTESL